MNVVRRDKALEDLADCAFYIAEDDPAVADRFVDAFEQSVEQLARMPYIGVAYPSENPALFGLRRWPVKGFDKYLISTWSLKTPLILFASCTPRKTSRPFWKLIRNLALQRLKSWPPGLLIRQFLRDRIHGVADLRDHSQSDKEIDRNQQ